MHRLRETNSAFSRSVTSRCLREKTLASGNASTQVENPRPSEAGWMLPPTLHILKFIGMCRVIALTVLGPHITL